MGEMIDFTKYKENNEPHIVQEVVCLACLHRWIAVRNEKTLLKELQCPYCKTVGSIIATGQQLEVDE